jgi:RNA polymerase sigma-70 factor (ECF subfamily)
MGGKSERGGTAGGAGVGATRLPRDKELVRRILAGDKAAFTRLVEHHHSPMVRLAAAFTSSVAVAEEVVQETWVAVLYGLPRFERRSSLKTWIFRILMNRARTRATREGRTIPFSALAREDDPDEETVDPSRFGDGGRWAATPRRWDDDTPERLLLRSEARAFIDQALAALPPRQRAVVALRDLEGWDAREVCNILGISEVYQRVLLHRGRSRLREALERYLDDSG